MDGYVGHLVNTSTRKKNKFNYFRHAFEAFAKFKPVHATITYDGQTIEENKVWFASVMNGSYFGGGMKIAPKAKREIDTLYLVVVKNIPKWLLILIFPTIYLGWHVIFKRFVDIYVCKEVSIHMEHPTYMQIDGDVEYPISDIAVKTFDL
ncbi:MAG: hypothetical protein IH571_02510 [Acholeplasmataceae bacterium]|nr:hypothetical protein [Acholeplasmataceae bacterium]